MVTTSRIEIFDFSGGRFWIGFSILLGAHSEIYPCASSWEAKLFPRLAPPRWKRKLDPPMEAPLFFWSQAKSAEQLISKIIFPTQYSDVTALIKNERASPQNAKLKNFLRVKLYLKSETNFFSLQVFTGSQGSKKWRRARHHHAMFLTKTKKN